MSYDQYALSPGTEAAIATEDYQDAADEAHTTGRHALATGDFTNYHDAFQRLQHEARNALDTQHRATHATTPAPRLQAIR